MEKTIFFNFYEGRTDMNRNEKQPLKTNRLMIEGKKEASTVSDFSEKSVGDGTQRTVRQRHVWDTGTLIGREGNYHLVKVLILI